MPMFETELAEKKQVAAKQDPGHSPLIWILPILLLLTAAIALFYFIGSKPEAQKRQVREKIWQVDVVPLVPTSLQPLLSLYGEVLARGELKAAAPGASVVKRLSVKEGDDVAAGDLLFSLDERDFQSAVTQFEADVSEAQGLIDEALLKHQFDLQSLQEEKTLLGIANDEVERAQRLKTQSLGSVAALDEARKILGQQKLTLLNRQLAVDTHQAKLLQWHARLERSRTQLAEARLALERSRVHAPFAGIVSEILVNVGDRVSNHQVLLTLYPLDQLEIKAKIPNRFQTEIQQALDGGRPLEATTTQEGQIVKLHLERLAGAADPSGIDAYFRFEKINRTVRKGNLLELSLTRPISQLRYAIPFKAIYGNSRIYLYQDQRLVGMDVEPLGETRDAAGRAKMLISHPNLQRGALLVTTHLPNAVTGLKVKVDKP